MSKFTPGLWFAKVGETATIRDAHDNQIGIMTHLKTKLGGRRDADEVAANAMLAADSPALLIELEHIVGRYESLVNDIFHGTPTFDSLTAEADKARALIAKHRGEK